MLDPETADTIEKLILAAEKVGANGYFALISGTTPDGRPMVIAIGVGDGCANLFHRATFKTIQNSEEIDGH